MSDRIKKYLPILNNFSNLNKKAKKKLFQTSEFVKCICEVCMNILKGNVPLKKAQKAKLHRMKNIVRRLGKKNKKSSLKSKKKFLIQKGGSLIPILLSLIAPIISNLFTNRTSQ
jgi:hypothetical protein